MKKIPLFLSTFSFVSAAIASPIPSLGTSPVLAQTSGCGSGWSNTALKVLSPVGSRQFRVACNEHDTCYDTFGKSKQECDKAFHNRMLGTCGRDHNTWAGRFLKIACNGRADAYYTGVSEGGQDKYDKAQGAATPSFSWSQAGAISGLTCTKIHEDADPHAWADNFLCSPGDIGMRWSQAGAIEGMKCTRIHEDADPHAWADNFLCVPPSSRVNFQWSQANPIGGMNCLKVHEDADPDGWSDNYLCW